MTRSQMIMQSKSTYRRSLILAVAAIGTLLALFSASAQAEDPFAILPGGFATEISTNQAGAHPDLRTKFILNQNANGSPTGGTPKDLNVILPKGLIGAPTATPSCPMRNVTDYTIPCPAEAMVGTVTVTLYDPGPDFAFQLSGPVYNTNPYPGEPAALAFNVIYPVRLDTYVRADGDYGVTASATNLTEAANVVASDLTLWGIPADHNGSGGPRIPFMTNPTECSGNPLMSSISIDTWQKPIQTASAEYSLGAITGCEKLDFAPTISAQPTTNLADAPSGLDFNLHVPQNPEPDANATAHLKDASVTFPAGMTVNPSSANGLGACSLEQIGMSANGQPNGSAVSCPDNSKLGTVQAISPAIGHPLPGSLYLAEQNRNPFGNLLALYLVIDDPLSGILVKLSGKVDPDPGTGQLTVAFKNNPQLPVEDLDLSLFKGPRAALKTPAACGTHTTTSSLVPWSSPQGADAAPSSSFALSSGPAGGACLPTGAAAPNQPTFLAGTLSPTAKAFSPLVMKLTRDDGSQPLKSIATTLPQGLLGKLAGTTYCPDGALAGAASRSGKAEQTSASCPPSSRVGSVNVGAGAGSTPLYVGGTAYLAGPYKSAPLSLAIITPAVAGPFDLGTVVVRVALEVNPETAQIRAVSDELPTILRGIPLDIRSVGLKMDRPQFILNPTSCNPMSIAGSAFSVFDQSASLTSPFRVADCTRLGFKPGLSIKLKGATKRSRYPALTASLKARPGDANIAHTVVALPHSEFLAQNHIRTVCTRVQFSAGAGNGAECPKGSIYGFATATTPLLDQPLSGSVYLRSSSNPLPDLVAALKGQIDVNLVGRIDSKNGGIRTTFASVPDAPVSTFVLSMQGGKKGLLENSRNLCKAPSRATVQMDGHNGDSHDTAPLVAVKCQKKGRKAKSGRGGR